MLGCECLVICCMDFRIQSHIKDWLEQRGLLGKCDLVAVPGGHKVFLKNKRSREIVFEGIKTARVLHGVRQVYIFANEDNYVGGGSRMFSCTDEELIEYQKELEKVQNLVQVEFPDVTVETHVMFLNGDFV